MNLKTTTYITVSKFYVKYDGQIKFYKIQHKKMKYDRKSAMLQTVTIGLMVFVYVISHIPLTEKPEFT